MGMLSREARRTLKIYQVNFPRAVLPRGARWHARPSIFQGMKYCSLGFPFASRDAEDDARTFRRKSLVRASWTRIPRCVRVFPTTLLLPTQKLLGFRSTFFAFSWWEPLWRIVVGTLGSSFVGLRFLFCTGCMGLSLAPLFPRDWCSLLFRNP